jgi:hypothetical protein
MFPFAGVSAEMAAAAGEARKERVMMVTRASSALFFGD